MVALLFPRTIGKVKIFFQDKNSLGLIFLRSVNPEFERKVDFQKIVFLGGHVFRICFFKLLNNDNEK